MSQKFDLIVIGGGVGGYEGAIRAAQLGMKVAVVEKNPTLGGTCLNVGCIPSKALLDSSEHYDHAKNKLKTHGVLVSEVKLDLDTMIKRKEKVVGQLTKGVEGLMKKNKIEWLKGLGSIAGSNQVQVGEQVYETSNILIATGSEAISIPSFPFDGQNIVSSTEALCFTEVPKHLVVVGGGVIGLELGSVWKRLGAKVTVIEAAKTVVPMFDHDIIKHLSRALQKQGIEMVLEAKVQKVAKLPLSQGGLTHEVIYTDSNAKEQRINCDKILVAVGRRAYTAGLNLEKVGIKVDNRGRVDINDHFQTNIPNIYAVGDVVRGVMLAHKSGEEGVACAEIIAGQKPHINYKAIPNVVYTHPEVAYVGATENELKDSAIAYKVGTYPFIANGRAKAMEETEGLVKILADAVSDEILGFHILGAKASEMIAEAAVAMEFRASAEDIARTSHAHPTLAEIMKEAALGVHGRSINI